MRGKKGKLLVMKIAQGVKRNDIYQQVLFHLLNAMNEKQVYVNVIYVECSMLFQ